MRTLQLLGEWYERGQILIFVSTQDKCDWVWQELVKNGYDGLSLHGGKDQIDRDYTISDFKKKERTLMVATSVAGRGLDVKDLVLVINYDSPNHLEDYVHRVGRTGRAGKKGTAYTFITDEEESNAPDLVKALTDGGKPVPAELQAMADGFQGKVNAGEARKNQSGFSGSGYTFKEGETSAQQDMDSLDKKEFEVNLGLRDEKSFQEELDEAKDGGIGRKKNRGRGKKGGKGGDDDDGDDGAGGTAAERAAAAAVEEARKAITTTRATLVAAEQDALAAAATAGAAGASMADGIAKAVAAAKLQAARIASTSAGTKLATLLLEQKKAQKTQHMIAAMNAQQAKKAAMARRMVGGIEHFSETVVINDYPQHARWKITHKETFDNIIEMTGCAITSKGSFFGEKAKVGPNDEKLSLLVEGTSEIQVAKARGEIMRILDEFTREVGERVSNDRFGKYSVL